MEKDIIIPLHILAGVFQKITDPKKLVRLQLISKDLKPHVDIALKRADWKGLCENEIGHYALSTIIKPILPKTSYDDFNDITLQSKWMKIYHSYLNWCKCLNSDRSLRQFSSKSCMWNRFFAYDKNTITCLDVWSGYIVVGSTKGTIHVFANFFLIKPRYIIKTGSKKINKIKIWLTASEELLIVSLDVDGYVRFWDIKQKTEKFTNTSKITDGIDLYINTSRNLYVVKETRILRLQLLPTYPNQLKSSECDFDLAKETCRILTLNFFEPHKISVFVRAGMDFILYSNVYDEPEDLNMSNVQEEPMPYMYVDMDANWPFVSFNNQSLMYLSHNCLNILNHFDYWRAFHMNRYFGGFITSIAWHGHYFLLGLEYGVIHIFYVENLACLEESTSVLYDTPMRILKVDSKPIIGIKVGQILDMPIIIAVTENDIYKIAIDE
ncbi:uncharacterized protein [Chelonus insularis]|uniref:uncharacterized protein n=1 Tax=Chelonus insularis TaxID=460826 RepID=UPI00158ECCED|nr:uncharacterized protein LOC118065457 [Chelonus insularis]